MWYTNIYQVEFLCEAGVKSPFIVVFASSFTGKRHKNLQVQQVPGCRLKWLHAVNFMVNLRIYMKTAGFCPKLLIVAG
jgi:hypothetical protein